MESIQILHLIHARASLSWEQSHRKGNPMSKIQDQQVIIFGGSSGIGLASAQALLAAGARVTVVSRSQGKLEAATRQVPGIATAVVDATDPVAVKRFFDQVDTFDHLVITVGGGTPPAPFHEITEDRFRKSFDDKFWAQFSVAQAGSRKLKRGGSITFITGAAARRAVPTMVPYAAINGAIESMVGPLALALAPSRVNAVAPGVIDTPFWGGMPDAARQGFFAQMGGKLPVGRVGTPEDVALAVRYLVENGFVTGSILDVEGGIRHASL
jgi:NAD(P)-dependent dehydrogenase (short-subunit alcohol dehydrogenase family)